MEDKIKDDLIDEDVEDFEDELGNEDLPEPPAPRGPTRSVSPETFSASPPLFVKVERYREIVGSINSIKSYLLNLRDTLDVLEEMHKEVANGIDMSHKMLDKLNMILSRLDSFFTRPHVAEAEPEEEHEPIHPKAPRPAEMEHYVKNVYGQLERLKNQLKTME